MKKTIALLLVVLMMSFVMAACTQQAPAPAEAPAPAPAAPAAQNPAPAAQPEAPAKPALNYPTKPIEIMLPYAAGGGQDVFSRITAKYMLKYLPSGSSVVVNNVTGGGGVIGATAMAGARNDGYTIGSIVPFQLTDQFVMKEIPYNETSFIPVGVGSYDCNFIIVSTKLGVKTFEEFVALAKEKPGKITMGMGGNWNVHDFFRLKLEKALGVKFARMSFDGGASSLQAVMSGDCDSSSNSISEALSAIEAGQVIPICVSTPERISLMPDVPTLKELGVDMTHGQWRCLTVPAGTDEAIQEYLAEILDKVYSDSEWIEECKQAGLAPVNYTGQAAKDYVSADFEIYKALINELGITPDFEF